MTNPNEFVFDVDESTFQSAVLDRSHEEAVIVDFWAPWCGPCRTLGPLLEQAVAARGGQVVLAKVNVDENQNLAAAFQIEGIPAVKAIRNAQLVNQFEGLLPPNLIEQFIDTLVPSEADLEAAQARAQESSNPAEVHSTYSKIIEKQSDHPAARLGLARLALAAGRLDEIESHLEVVPPGGEDGHEADRIRSEAAMRQTPIGDEPTLRRQIAAESENPTPRIELGRLLAAQAKYPESLQVLLEAAELDREAARGPVKEMMVNIFHAIGVRSDLADDYRSKLQRLMY